MKSGKSKALQAPRRVCILVVGMHRSGTSALTRVLSLLGCDLPKTLMSAHKSNETGHWESDVIRHFNDRILASAGTSWEDWVEVNPGWLQSPKAEQFREEALQLLQEEYQTSCLFVLKDPRICRLVPFWLSVLERAGVRTLIVSQVRNPLEVAASLAQRNGFEVGIGHLLWLRHVLDAEVATRNAKRLFISYDRLLGGWARTALDAQEALGIVWPRMSDQVVGEIEAFLSDHYRHYCQPVEAVLENPILSGWLRDTFKIVDRWAAEGENPLDFSELDRIRTAFGTAAPAFSRLLGAEQEREKRLGSELGMERQRRAESEQQMSQLKTELESRTGAVKAAEQALAEVRSKLETAEKTIAAEREAAEQALAEVRSKLEMAENTTAAEQRAANQALADVRSKLEAAEKTTAAEQERAKRLESELDKERQRHNSGQGGAIEHSERSPMQVLSPDDVATIRSSQLFDAEWYLVEYPDVKVLGVDAAEHYLMFGARMNRHPSQSFDSVGYLDLIPELAETGLNPLIHYLKWGKKERRAIFPVRHASKTSAAPKPDRGLTRQAVPRIIYESHNLKLQGAPNSLFEIASGVNSRRRFHATLVSSSLGPIAQLADRDGVSCLTHSLPASRIKSREQGNEFVHRLAGFYMRMQPALVHVNTLQNFHCVKAAHQAGLPCIWNIRESEDPDSYYDDLAPDVRELAYSAFAEASAVVFVADATRQLWGSRLDGVVESLTISNGIDISRMMRSVYGTSRSAVRASLDLRDDDILLLNVGTVIERKGQLDLVDAVRRLDKLTRQNLVVAIVGFNDSAYSRKVMAQLQELEAEGLRFIAVNESLSETERTRVAELYLGADAFVLTSRVESYPRVTLEAMHFGLPIISTQCFGVCEQLVEGQSGLFYDYGDTEKLSQLVRFLCDGERRRAIAAGARDQLKQLNSYDSMLDAYEALYTRLIAAHSQPAASKESAYA